jgi:hypothetical protein
VTSNPPIFSKEELALIPVRLIIPPRTLGGKGNPTVSLQSGSNSETHHGSQTPSSDKGTPSEQQTIQFRRDRMDDDIKLPIFRGTRLEDPHKHWFLCKVVWNIKHVQDNGVKMA